MVPFLTGVEWYHFKSASPIPLSMFEHRLRLSDNDLRMLSGLLAAYLLEALPSDGRITPGREYLRFRAPLDLYFRLRQRSPGRPMRILRPEGKDLLRILRDSVKSQRISPE